MTKPSRALAHVITTLVILFVMVGLFVFGSVQAIDFINSEDIASVTLGFVAFLAIGIVEILLVASLWALWRN